VTTFATQAHANARQGLGAIGTVLRERPCRIAYVGNSVTAQKDGYVRYLHEHISASCSQPHIAIQAGLGGMGSMGCLFTLDQFVLNRKPDLCFIECTVGDCGSEPPLETIGPAVEGLVRKLHAAGCACCILHAYRNDRAARNFPPIIACYEQVADHYGIPSIHLAEAVTRGLAAGEWNVERLFTDGIHTTLAGARVIAALVAEALKPILSAAPFFTASLGPRLNPDVLEATLLLPPNVGMVIDPERCRSLRFRLVLQYLEIDAGNGLTIDAAPGKLAGLLIVAGPHSGDIVVETNGQVQNYPTWDKWCDRDLLRSVVFRQSIQRDARVRLMVTDRGGRNRNGIGGPSPETEKLLKLVGFMLYDEHATVSAVQTDLKRT
jgi:hypothetical protein